MKKEKGITLLALTITVIVLLILASIATYSGISTIKSSKLNKFKQELEIMQAQVEILYEKYKEKDTIDIGKDISGSGKEEEANTAFNGAEETETSGYRLFDAEEIKKLGVDGIERNYLLDIMRRKVICLEGFEYDGNIYYTLEQLTEKNVIDEGITREDVTFEYTTEELSSGGWKVKVFNIKFSKYVGKGIIQYKDTSTGKITTVETNAKEGESYEFTINNYGTYDIIVTDAAEKIALKTINLGSSYDGIYSVPDLEGKIALEDLFIYEVITQDEGTRDDGLPNSTARIIGMNPKYCNSGTYYNSETGETYLDTNYDIILGDGTKLTDTLVIPYQKEIDGKMYRITEVSLYVNGMERTYLPNVETIIYPNTVTRLFRINKDNNISFSGGGKNKKINKIILPVNLQNIDTGALSLCENLTSMTIPNSVTSIGNWAFSGCDSLTNITIPNSVTSIGDSAFYSCESLTSIIIPNSVTSIGKSAFSYCKSLNNITIPNSVTSIKEGTFNECDSLTNITIPNNVISIERAAFYACDNLINITIPNSVTSIGDSSFRYCSSLTNIEIPNSVTSIEYNTFNRCSSLTNIEIPNSITSIESTAFSECTSITSIEIPNSVTSIGSDAFAECTSLTSIEIPNSVTSIGNSPFYGCSSLISIKVAENNIVYDSRNNCNAIIKTSNNELIQGCKNTIIPSSVTSIESGAFAYCIGLTNIIIPNSVINIGDDVFSNCVSLKNIEIPNSVTSIGNDVFSNCVSLKNVEIPNSVTSIGNNTFDGCTGLTSITIPNRVTSIGNSAFNGCTGLTSITIPSSVISIGEWAFANCAGLTSITIPSSVTSIGGFVFYSCTGLTSITIPSSVTSIGGWTFYNWTSSQTINIQFKENEIPSGWDEDWNYKCSATINYLQ